MANNTTKKAIYPEKPSCKSALSRKWIEAEAMEKKEVAEWYITTWEKLTADGKKGTERDTAIVKGYIEKFKMTFNGRTRNVANQALEELKKKWKLNK